MLNPKHTGVRVQPVYGSALDVYTGQNNYINNSLPQVGGGCEIQAYTGIRQMSIHGKLII